MRSNAPLQRTWGVKGQTPVVATSGKRQAVNAISAVNRVGAFWYNVYTGRLNAPQFIVFLNDFLKCRRRPVFLVVDRHPAHLAKAVAQHVQSLQGRLELHFLPGYAPELNPDEFVWNHLRQKGISKTPPGRNESLRTRVEADLAAVKNNPPLVRSFFRAPSVDYGLISKPKATPPPHGISDRGALVSTSRVCHGDCNCHGLFDVLTSTRSWTLS
ncbi:MAG: transposase [Phycisphaerales bacterium]|nr:transposase [Phycisphaerales bacterium]